MTFISHASTVIDGIYYSLNSTYKIAEVVNNDDHRYLYGDIIIPSEITYEDETYTVRSIGDRAFSYCIGLTSVSIPNSVTSIGYRAFEDCVGLTSLIIPNSVIYISDNAFEKCSSLTSITIPSSVISIGTGIFEDCNGIERAEFHCKNVEDWFRCDNKQLKEIIIGDEVVSIGESAFSNCDKLTSVTIPNSVKSIGKYAFKGCTNIASVSLSNSLTSIEEQVFCNCNNLVEVVIPNSVTTIGAFAYEGCTGLKSLTIPNSVTNIDYRAFIDCNGIERLEFHCKAIENIVYDNSSLKELIIGDEVASIGENAFSGSTYLTSVTIPNSVKSIGEYAFAFCTSLSSVTISQSLTTIERSVFVGCTSLTNVTIPNSVTYIDSEAFKDCKGLKSVTIPNSVINIDENAYENCDGVQRLELHCRNVGNWFAWMKPSLKEIIIGDEVSSIAQEAFKNHKNVRIVKSYDVYAFPIDCFASDTYKKGTLYVPTGSAREYAYTTGWDNFDNIIENLTTEHIYLKIWDSQSGTSNLRVDFGERYSFEISPSDTQIEKVYFNDEDVTSQLDDKNIYTTPRIFKNSTLKIVYKDSKEGDLNGDGEVNVADHVRLTEIILNQ